MNPTHLIDQAKAHADRKEFDKALACLNAYIHDNPRASAGYINRGIIFRLQGKFDKALAEFESAIRLTPRNPDPYLGRADLYRAQKQHPQAVADYSRALSLDPKSRHVYALRGEALFHMKKLPEALADFNKSLQSDHEQAEVYQLRGMTHLALNLHEKALGDFAVALRISPRDSRAFLGRALTYWQLLEYGKAMEALNHAAVLAQTRRWEHEIYERRANLNLITGHPLRALADYLRHEQRRPDHRAAYFLRPLCFWTRRLFSLLAIRAKCLLGSLTIKPLVICLERPFLALVLWRLSKVGLFTRRSRQYPKLAFSQLVNAGTPPVDPDLFERAADCFVAACDAPDAPDALKKTRAGMDRLIIINLDASKNHYLSLVRKNVKAYRIAILGKSPKTADLVACTQYLAEELVWLWQFKSDVYCFRFCMTREKELKPRAWDFYLRNKPEIDAYLERFCKAKLAEYAKSPAKPRAWPYYGVKA